jgi:hypothetical protein
MAIPSDFAQATPSVLSALNTAINLSALADADVSGANTFSVFRARVASNLDNVRGVEAKAAGPAILRGLTLGFNAGILTDARLNGLTTTAAVLALCTFERQDLASSYNKFLPQ